MTVTEKLALLTLLALSAAWTVILAVPALSAVLSATVTTPVELLMVKALPGLAVRL